MSPHLPRMKLYYESCGNSSFNKLITLTNTQIYATNHLMGLTDGASEVSTMKHSWIFVFMYLYADRCH